LKGSDISSTPQNHNGAAIVSDSILFHCTLLIAVIILGFSKGGFSGLGMLSTPILSLAVGPLQAIGILLPIMLFQDVHAMWLYRKAFHVHLILRMLVGASIGIVLGYYFATRLSVGVLEFTLGTLSCLFAFREMVLQRNLRAAPTQTGLFDRILATVCGAASAFTSTVAHAGTPPFMFYMLPKQLDRETFISASVYFFGALNAFKLPTYIAMGNITTEAIPTTLLYVPVALAANQAGSILARRMNLVRFQKVTNATLFLIGCVLIGRSLLANTI
jgi:uncharacterized protein